MYTLVNSILFVFQKAPLLMDKNVTMAVERKKIKIFARCGALYHYIEPQSALRQT